MLAVSTWVSLVSFWACFSPCGRSSLASGRFHVQRGSVLVLYAASPFSPFSDVHFVRLGDFGTYLTLALAVCMVSFCSMAILSVCDVSCGGYTCLSSFLVDVLLAWFVLLCMSLGSCQSCCLGWCAGRSGSSGLSPVLGFFAWVQIPASCAAC